VSHEDVNRVERREAMTGKEEQDVQQRSARRRRSKASKTVMDVLHFFQD
jgi:hypothetical protein